MSQREEFFLKVAPEDAPQVQKIVSKLKLKPHGSKVIKDPAIQNYLFIPILSSPPTLSTLLQTEIKGNFKIISSTDNSIHELYPILSEVLKQHMDTNPQSQNIGSVQDNIADRLNLSREKKNVFPKRWERIGNVIIFLKFHPFLKDDELAIAETFVDLQKKPNHLTVLIDEEGIKGELRRPSTRILVHQPNCKKEECQCSVTVHNENGVNYALDLSRIMFASGNGTERIHFSKIKPKNEIFVDMFVGIGYFSLPLAIHSENCTCVCIEKNPESMAFFKKNLEINPVKARVVPFLGDNREVADEYLGKADRISMGYLPTPKQFLSRAFDFLNSKQGGIIHYHHTCKKEEKEKVAMTHIQEALQEWFVSKNQNSHSQVPAVRLLDFRKVKSYAPKIFHCVADVSITFFLK